MAVRAITFDFWRTLFRDAEVEERRLLRVAACVEALGLPAADIDEAIRVTWQEFDRCHREEQRTLSPLDAVTMTCERLGVSLQDGPAAKLCDVFATAIVQHSPVPIDGALEAVQAAAAHGPVGLISDTGVSPGSSLSQLLARHGFLDYFDALIWSDEVGVSKPQRLMFERAAHALGVKTNELLHIGDLEYTDIIGAHAVGAKAALFAGDNARHKDATSAEYVFESWREFMAALPETLAGKGR
jgi:putative hydrolase of the HAD superfamily